MRDFHTACRLLTKKMDRLPTPAQTPTARQWLARTDAPLDSVERALLGTINGRRNVVELESVARAMGLGPDALESLRLRGLIDFAHGAAARAATPTSKR